MNPPSSVTIRDIAERANVHPATVSRALRGVSARVSPAKRAEIERIAAELGYRPNVLAANLRTKRSNLVAIVVPDLGNPLFGPLVQGLEVDLRQRQFLCLVVQTPSVAAERAELVDVLADRQINGLLILAAEKADPMLDAAVRRRLPTVLVNRGFGERRFSCVVNDDRESVLLVLEHLTGLGHRAIGHLAGPATSSTGRARKEAFVELTRERRLATCPVIDATAFTRDAGRAAMTRLLASSHRVSAVFAANDLIALGALDVLREHKIDVPRQMSLVGHNDMPLVDLIAPALTSVRVPVSQMSRQAARLLIERMETNNDPPSTLVLAPELIVRASTTTPVLRSAQRADTAVAPKAARRR